MIRNTISASLARGPSSSSFWPGLVDGSQMNLKENRTTFGFVVDVVS